MSVSALARRNRQPAQRRAVSVAQRKSWAADREARRLATAKGQVAAYLRDHPEDLHEVMTAAATAVADARSES
jgi:hypothetical protein